MQRVKPITSRDVTLAAAGTQCSSLENPLRLSLQALLAQVMLTVHRGAQVHT